MLSKENLEDVYPLSPMQEGLLYQSMVDKRSDAYFEQIAYRLRGHLDTRLFERAWQVLIDRHHILRTVFTAGKTQRPLQLVLKQCAPSVTHIDLRDVDSDEQSARIDAFRSMDRRRSFDLARDVPSRITIFQLDAAYFEIMWSFHHILLDGWSVGVLLGEFMHIYGRLRAGSAPSLPRPQPYNTYIKWLEAQDKATSKRYWTGYLEGYEGVSSVPAVRSAAAEERNLQRSLGTRIDRERTSRLQELAAQAGVTLNTVMSALWAMVLERQCDRWDLMFGIVNAGRPPEIPGVESMVGLFINTVPQRVTFSTGETFIEFVRRLQTESLQGRAHCYLPLADLQVRPGMIDHLFVFESYPLAERLDQQQAQDDHGLTLESIASIEESHYSMNVVVTPGECLRIEFQYNERLYDREQIVSLLASMETAIDAVLADPRAVVASIDVMPVAERVALRGPAHDRPPDPNATLWSLFAEQVAVGPRRIAVTSGDTRIDYEQLYGRARSLAAALASRCQLSTGARVGVILERSDWLVASFMGILHGGGVYVPIDPALPRERAEFILRDSESVAVIGTASTLDALSVDPGVARIDVGELDLAATPTPGSLSAPRPEDVAYVIYTSGSTGEPKGVMNEHRGLVNLMAHQRRLLRVDEHSVVALVASPSFDASVWEMLVALVHGASLAVAHRQTIADPKLFGAFLREQGVTLTLLTPGYLRLLDPDDLAALETLISGGEAANVDTLMPLVRRIRCINAYGPSEASIITTCHEIDAKRDYGSSIPIGKPIDGAQVLVLDSRDRITPIGTPGELCIAGVGVGRGYVRRPDLDAVKFPRLPAGAGERMYRTGDVVRRQSDGELEFVGRNDDQVKVRGYRIELGEIQAVLVAHPEIRDAFVMARDGADGLREIYAYLAAERAPDIEVLKEYLRKRLPDYMVPACFVMLERLPLTTSGKVDRAALPDPSARTIDSDGARNPIEAELHRIWSKALGVDKLGIHDDFYDAGGHSLKAIQVVSQIRKELNAELTLSEFSSASTIAELAALVSKIRGDDAPIAPIERILDAPHYALSATHKRLWVLDQMGAAGSAYNIGGALLLEGEFDPAAFERALQALVARHEALRTTFRLHGGEPRQEVHAQVDLALERVDLSSTADPLAEARGFAERALAEPFDLGRGPLLRVALLRLGERRHVFVYTMHHIVGDGVSVGVITRELSALYAAQTRGRSSELAPPRLQARDFAAWQNRWLASDEGKQQRSFWLQRLAGELPVLDLPTDYPRPRAQRYEGSSVSRSLGAVLSGAVTGLARTANATPFMTLATAVALLLHRLTGQRDIILGHPVAARVHPDLQEIVAPVVNTLALRVALEPGQSFSALLEWVRRTTLANLENQLYPFDLLVEELDLPRDHSRHPIFDVMLVLQSGAQGRLDVPGVTVTGLELEQRIAKFDLLFTFTEHRDQLSLVLDYNRALFAPDHVERMVDHLVSLIESAAADPGQPIDRLPLWSADQRQRLLDAWNADDVVYPPKDCLTDLFEARARQTPEAIAVTCEGETITYGELDRRGNRLARVLRARGVAPDVLVGVCLEHSIDLIVALLGIFKAGGAYVPLDPNYPAQRLEFMLADTGVPILLTFGQLSSRLPASSAEILRMDALADTLAATSDAPVERATLPHHLAYVIYTSGSTGRPKGVMVSHHNVVRLFMASARHFEFTARDVWTLFHSYAFDFSVWEIWGALIHGARLVVVPYWVTRDPSAFHRLLREQGVTVLNQTPSAFRQLVHADAAAGGTAGDPAGPPMALRYVIFGGEALNLNDLQPWWHRHGDERPKLVNMYGITETTVHVTFHALSQADLARSWSSVIGTRLADLRIYVLDAHMQPVPTGVRGELYVGGAGVARGYLGRPDLTAARFVRDLFSDEPGERLYRSGDLVRWLPSGELEYHGRIDQQVKLRGHRIELGEIDAALGEHPRVREAVVLLRDDVAGEPALIAYCTSSGHDALTSEEARGFLRRTLPEVMVPSAVVILDSFPLTPTGKLDRKALPAPDAVRQPRGDAATAPRTALEEQLVHLWEQVLQVSPIGVEDNFFDLGGQSLKAIRLAARIHEQLAVEVSLRDFFERPTVADLAESIHRGRTGTPTLEPIARATLMPASPAQRRLWFIERLEGPSPTYNTPLGFMIRGPLDLAALDWAFAEIQRRHEVLRTVFEEVDGQPMQRIAAAPQAALVRVNLAEHPPAEQPMALRAVLRDEAEQPFDLARGPLMRGRVVSLSDGHHALVVNMHHIVTDGWSMGVFAHELGALYGARVAGRPSPLPALDIQYADYAVWQNAWLESDAPAAELAYWTRQLASAPFLDLRDLPVPPAPSTRGGVEEFHLPADMIARLVAVGREQNASLFMVLLSAFAVLLSRYSGQEDIVIGSPIAGRGRRALLPMMGFFANTLALRVDLTGDPSFAELLARVRAVTLDAYANQDVPFERVIEALAPERRLGDTPLFQVMLVLQDSPASRPGLPQLEVRPLELERLHVHFPLLLSMTPAESTGQGPLTGLLGYQSDRFQAATIRRLIEHFGNLLRAIAGATDLPLSQLTMSSAEERRQLISEFNATAVPRRPGVCLPHLVQRQAERTPDAPAVSFAGRSLSYRQLMDRAVRLADHLRALGVGPDVRVGLAVPRSEDLAVGVLGILTAGGAYVPIDTAYPPSRIAFMMADANLAVLLTTTAEAGKLPDTGIPRMELDRLDDLPSQPLPPRVPLTPDNLAYVIYTSGSTGTPKGVAMPHAALVNLVEWNIAQPDFKAGARALQFASPSFDVSCQELFTTWASGGTLIMVDEDTRRDFHALLDFLHEQRVERVFLPFIALSHLAEVAMERDQIPFHLREVITAGEQLRITPSIAALFERLDHCVLSNHYGPSETHVATAHRLTGPVASWPTLPAIGRPIDNTTAYVLDQHMNLCPIGVVGELYLGGLALARGYLGQPALTAQRFVNSPFGGSVDERLYRTGDLVRQDADGTLWFLGRADDQVKIRGFRVEPGEVEACLASRGGVADVVVTVVEDRQRQHGQLVAYVVLAEGQDVREGDLRAHVASRLPDYMVPSAIVLLERLPTTPSGKIDRRRLPAPAMQALDVAAGRAPVTETEMVLTGMWEELLDRHPISPDDDFFALGGHSLLATQLASRVRHAFGVDLSLRRLFDAPTIAAIAADIDAARTKHPVSPTELAITPLAADEPRPLSFAQERLWILDRLAEGTSAAYNMPAALILEGALDASAFEASVRALFARHDVLRARIAVADGAPRLDTESLERVPFEYVDLQALSGDALAADLDRRRREHATRPFDLTRGPLARVTLLRLADNQHALLVTLHHIICDGWSIGILVRELGELYEAHRLGQPPHLPALPIQYGDFAHWQREWLSRGTLQRQLRYWTETLAGAPLLLELPLDHARPPRQSSSGAAVVFEVEPQLSAAVRRLASDQGATIFMVLVSAFATLLGRYSRQRDVVIGTPIANRNRVEVEGLIGLFANTLPLRVDLAGEPSTNELLAQVRSVALGAYAHQDVPFEQLVAALDLPRDLAYSPVFQVLFVLQNAPMGALELGDVRISPMRSQAETARLDLVLSIEETAEGLRGSLEYSSDLFDEARIQRMAGHFCQLLAGMVETPAASVYELPILSPAERHRLAAWSQARADFVPRSIVGMMSEISARTPGAIALELDDRQMSYGELRARAGQLARYLCRSGVGPEVLVGVCLERSFDAVVAFLAVLEAGGAYLPLDPDYPRQRLAYMLGDAAPKLVLTWSKLVERVSGSPARIVHLDDWASIGAADDGAALPDIAPDQLAYVIYTSGSTGTPKGVMIEHRGLSNLVQVQTEAFDVRPGDRVLQFASLSFDASISEILVTLCAGATLVLADKRALLPGPAFTDLLRARGITSITLPPTVLSTFSPEDAPALRVVVSAGEDCHTELVERWAGAVRFINAYGPTEATVCATLAVLDRDSAPTIGRPIANCRVAILGPDRQPLPVGVPGELYIASVGLARGYLGAPELSAERFIADVASEALTGRLYKTGDLACWTEDGNIRFLGRVDDQLKLRGFRIEPREIEIQLMDLDQVAQASVVLHRTRPGHEHLVAYVEPATGGAPLSPLELRRHLSARLPEFMIPSEFVVVRSLPKTPNLKVDRNALADGTAGDLSSLEYIAPREPTELRLVELWKVVLGVADIGVRSDFFEHGGHSMRALELATSIEREFGLRLPLAALFQHSTIEEQALLVRTGRPSERWSPLVPLQREGTGMPVLCVHPAGGHVLCYRDLAMTLAPEQPVYGLQQRGVEDGQTPLATVEEMAEEYLDAVAAVLQPERAVLVLGWSFGGLVAYEMAMRLRAQGRQVRLALLDAYAPAAVPAVTRDLDEIDHLVSLFSGELALSAPELRAMDSEARWTHVLDRARAAALYPPDFRPEHVRRLLELFIGNGRAVHRYAPAPSAVPTLLIRSRADDQAQRDAHPTLGWRALLGDALRVADLACRHEDMVRGSHGAELVGLLRGAFGL